MIVELPGFENVVSLSRRGELVDVQPCISQSTVKRLNEGVSHRFAGPKKVELHAHNTPNLRAPVIRRNGAWALRPVQGSIDNHQDPKRLPRRPGYHGQKSCSRAPSVPPVPEPVLKAGRYIPSSHPLPIHEPVFTPQQHPDPHVAEPWVSVGQIANAESKALLILRPSSSIPGGSTEVRKPTGPCTPYLQYDLKSLSQFPPAGEPPLL